MRLLVLFLTVVCSFSAVAAVAGEQHEITTAPGRKSKLTRRYELAEVRKLVEARPKDQDPFNVSHPLAPDAGDLKKIEAELKKGGALWYFLGLDSGWVVMRDQKPALILVVSHEY